MAMKRFPLVLALALSAFVVTGCGLFSDDPDDDPGDIAIKESVPVDFSLDDEQMCPPSEDCDADPQPSPAAVDLPPVELPPVQIDVIEMTESPELEEASSRLKKAEIESIDYVIEPNSLNVPSPELDIFLAPHMSMNKDADGAFKLGTLPSAEPMTTKEGTIDIPEDVQAQSSDLFKALKLAVIAAGERDIQEGEMFPPQGKADYTLTFNLKFTTSAATIAQ
jgi:hypothetical protein